VADKILTVSYLMAAILNFAATGRQGAAPTCSRCFFFKSHDLTYYHAKFQRSVTQFTILTFSVNAMMYYWRLVIILLKTLVY